jgi:hypothetical protein
MADKLPFAELIKKFLPLALEVGKQIAEKLKSNEWSKLRFRRKVDERLDSLEVMVMQQAELSDAQNKVIEALAAKVAELEAGE